MDAKTLLFVGLGLVLIVYAAALIRSGFVMPTVLQTAIGFVTAFFDTLGIGSFATTTAVYKLRSMVPVKLIPGTLNVGHTLPTIAQAFIYTRIVPVESTTLVLMIVAAVAGSWLGAGVVVRWPRRRIQIGMGLALLAAAALMLMTALQLFPSGGETLGLSGARLVAGLAGNFTPGGARPGARRAAGGARRRPDRGVHVARRGSLARGRGRGLHRDQHAADGGRRAGRAGFPEGEGFSRPSWSAKALAERGGGQVVVDGRESRVAKVNA